MGLGQSAAVPCAIAPGRGLARRPRDAERARVSERRALRARLRTEILPGLEQLDDPSRDPAELIALADAEGRRVRAMLTCSDADAELVGFDPAERRAREDEREWVRGYLHDTALQILEFIAGDGFGTGLTAARSRISPAGPRATCGAGSRRTTSRANVRLVPELEQVTAEARALDQGVRLVVGDIETEPTGEQVTALTGAVREAMTNARKHARASLVVVRVRERRRRAARRSRSPTTASAWISSARRAAAGSASHGSIVGRMQRVGGHASLGPRPGRRHVRHTRSAHAQGAAVKIRVVVVDDFPLVRDGVARALDADPAIEVVGQAGTGREALRARRGARARRHGRSTCACPTSAASPSSTSCARRSRASASSS